MRIIAGRYKGRKLSYGPKSLPVRPMTDKVKETLFNVLSPYFFDSCRVLDLFSGTGSLALEALSRGASEAHAVEKNPLCLQLIKKNSAFLDKNQKRLWLYKKNALSLLKRSSRAGLESGEPPPREAKNALLAEGAPVFDFVFADPPFPLRAGASIMEALSQSSFVDKKTVIAIETGAKEPLKSQYGGFFLFSQKDFNDKKLWFYKSS